MNIFKGIDWLVFFPVIIMTTMSIVTLVGLMNLGLGGVTTNLIYKHIFSIVLGIVFCIIITNIDYRQYGNYIYIIFAFNIIILIAVLLFGSTINGSKSWFRILGFSFQPVEIVKITVILITAKYISNYYYKIESLWIILNSLIPVSILAFLVMLQPDFGSTMILILLWVLMLFLSGINKWYIVLLTIIGLLIIITIWFGVFKDYQKQRVITFLNPTTDPLGSGYNAVQSIKSVKNGGFKGILVEKKGIVSVPEIETDFIFSGFAQLWGMIGVTIYFVLLITLITRIMFLSFTITDIFPKIILIGTIILLTVQNLINIAMNIGLAPITGIPLLFMSSGGSSMIASFAIIGLVFSIKHHSKDKGISYMSDDYDLFI